MNVRELLWDAARAERKRALPILSFPAVQKLGVTVDAMIKSAQLQTQAMEIVARETDTLAAISPMDLSVEAEAFGSWVRFAENEVPTVEGCIVSDEDEANALEIPEVTSGRAALCVEAVRMAKQRIDDMPVIAGMIGPYTLAGRLMSEAEIMFACYDEPETVHIVLDKATQFLIRYGQAMKEAGADGIMMAEPLAGVLGPALAAEFSMPYVKRIIAALQTDDFAVIYHNCGYSVSAMLEMIYAQGAAAYHFGNAVNMASILASTPEDVLVMGNIDPASEFAGGTAASITAATRSLMETCGGYKNFIPSSGCDIPAHASWENIHAFYAALNK